MALYSAAYYRQREINIFERHIAYRQEYERLTERVPDKGSVLDWGCGTGDFLELFTGWERYGVEVSDYAIRESRAKGIRIIDTVSAEKFDLAVFRGVLQHLDEPFTALRSAHRALYRGGALAILAQPDADSLCYRLFGELPALDPPRNWWIPGARELVNILDKLGFVNIEILRPYWGGPYAHPLRDFTRFLLRFAGIRRPFAFPGNMIELYAQKG